MTFNEKQLEALALLGGGAKKSAANSVLPAEIAEQLNDEEKSIWQRTYDKVFAICNDAIKATLAAMGAVNRARSGLAVKSRKDSDGSVIVEGWAILFADENHRDIDKTWFGPNTQYLLDFYKGAPLWLEHGEDPLFQSNPIGYRVSQMVYPEHGIYLGHKIDPTLPIYEEEPDLFEEVIGKVEAGMLGYSSDSIFHHVYEGFNPTNGELLIWPMAGCSLVERQAEPGLGPVVAKHIQERIAA